MTCLLRAEITIRTTHGSRAKEEKCNQLCPSIIILRAVMIRDL